MEAVPGMEKILVAFAAALAIGVSAVATAWAQSKIGSADRWRRSMCSVCM